MLLFCGCSAAHQQPTRDKQGPIPRRYQCIQTRRAPQIDGRLTDSAWDAAAWTEDFVDIEGDRRTRPRFRTRAKLLWDEECLYIGAELDEPHVWATLTRHDAIIFHDNDFEIFIDPDGDSRDYVEIEVNAFNTIFDLLLKRTYIEGGPALHDWRAVGLRTAVHVQGTLNDPSDTDKGWSVECAIPWDVFGSLTDQPLPPQPGDTWRMNFSRVEWRHEVVDGTYGKIAGTKEDNWVWSPQGTVNMHLPDRWGYVVFETGK